MTVEEILVTLLLGKGFVQEIDNWQVQADRQSIQEAITKLNDHYYQLCLELIGDDLDESQDSWNNPKNALKADLRQAAKQAFNQERDSNE